MWDEAWEIVNGDVEKAKSLKIMQSDDPVEIAKSLQAINPDDPIAKLLMAQHEVCEAERAKALVAEEAKLEVEKQKAYESGEAEFNRLSTDTNTTNQIVDALAAVEVSNPEAFKVISKALSVGNTALNAGELFPDVGIEGTVEVADEATYVENKAKSLCDADPDLNIRAAHWQVKQTSEFKTLYPV